MENFNNIPNSGTYGAAIALINANFQLTKEQLERLEHSREGFCGMYDTSTALEAAYPNPTTGSFAYVGTDFPMSVYLVSNGAWYESSQEYDGGSVDLTQYASTSSVTALASRVATLEDAGYLLAGIANPSVAPDSSNHDKRYLFAWTPGTYSSYGQFTINNGEFGILIYNGSSWSLSKTDLIAKSIAGGYDTVPTEDSTKPITSGAVYDALEDIGDTIPNVSNFDFAEVILYPNERINLSLRYAQEAIAGFTLLSATASKAGLLSAADKAKVDAFLGNLRSIVFADTTTSADQSTKITETLKITVGGVQEAVTTLQLLAATTSKAGLLSAADKTKLDNFLTNVRSMVFADTTASADESTKLTETLKWTVGGAQEIITSLTMLAATTSKAGLMSADDKAKLNTLFADGYKFAGVATPSTTPISTTSKIFYIATEAGTYFNAVTVTQGINIIYKSGDAWSVAQVVGIDNDIKYQSDNFIKSGSIANQKIYSSQISPTFIANKAFSVDSTQFKMIDTTIKNVLVFRYDGISDYVDIEGIDYSSPNTVWWLMKDWDNWVRDSYIVFYRRKVQGKLSSYSDLKYIALEYHKDENIAFNPEKAKINWFSEEQTSNKVIASSNLLIPYQTLENKAVGNFAISDFNDYCIKQYNVTEGDKYALSCLVDGGSDGFIAWWFGANGYPIKCELRNTSGQQVSFRDIIMTAPKGAQHLFINMQTAYQDSCYVYSITVIDAETEELSKTVEANTIASSRQLKNRLLCEKLPGQFPSAVDGHIRYNQYVDSYVFANIDPTKTYVCRGFAGNGGWTSTAFISYWNGDIWLGIDTNMYFPTLESAYVQEDDYLLHMPHNCNKVIIISDTVHCPTADLLSIATHIDSQELLDSISECTKTEQTCTILAGQFPSYVDGHIIDNQYVDSFEFANIDPTKRYVTKGFGFGTSAFSKLAFIHYYHDTTWLGIDEGAFVEQGPYVQTEDYLMSIPKNCNKIVIISQHNRYTPTLNEVTLGNRINSQELKDKIDANTEAISELRGGNSKLMKVTKSAAVIYVRTALNDNEDIIVSYIHKDNDQYTWGSVYLGSKTAQDSEILANEIKSMGDSTSAIGIANPAPWHLWAQHGYCIPYIIATHGLTADDIGSIWKDQRDRQYTIGNVSGDRIYLLPTIRDTEYPGVKTRDWKSPTTVNNPEITSLIHVSGATHTTTINATSWSDTQLKPMMVLDKRVFTADGKEITNDGIYYCDDFVISDTFKCTDPWTIETHFPSVVQKEIGAIFSQTFAIHGLSCRYDTTYDMKKSYLFSWYGVVCIQHFVPTNKLSGYDVYGMLPRVSKNDYAVPHLVNNLSRSGEIAYRKQDDLYDIDKQADRYITFFKNSTTGDMKIGCAGGYSLTRGMTKDSIRNTISRIYQSGDRDIVSISPSLGNKAYLKIITDSNFENGILPSTFIGQFSTYLAYFNPMANTGQVYWYKDGRDYVIYAHYQEAHNKLAINLPKEMEGLSVEVVDYDGVSLITDIVNSRKIYVDVGDSGHSYIVLKTK